MPEITIPGGDGAGALGKATFSATGGTISNLQVSGRITNVTRSNTGLFVVTITSTSFYTMAASASDDSTAAMSCYYVGNAASKTSTGFVLGTVGIGAGLRDPGVVDITIF